MTENKVAVEQIDREDAWPFRPSCYKEADKEKWLSGLYDSVAVIRAFAFARHRTCALEASQAGAGDVMREALIKCRDQFLFYAESHRAKETPDGYAKAVTNQNMAMMCEDALTTPTRIEAAQVDVDANRKVALRNLEKSGLRAPTEASQPQEAGERLAIRLCEWSLDGEKPVPLMQEAAAYIRTLTPPQAAESGLLDEAIECFNAILDRGPERDAKWFGMTAKDIALHFLAKAGKPGEAGNG